MRHLRDAIITVVAILGMFWVTSTLGQALWPWRQSVVWAESVWFDRAVAVVVAFVVGATLMRLLRWRRKVLAIVAVPFLPALVNSFWIYTEMRAYGGEIFALDMILLGLMVTVTHVSGLLAGVVFAHLLAPRVPTMPPNKSLELTREG